MSTAAWSLGPPRLRGKMPAMPIPDTLDQEIRTAAFIHVRRMLEIRDPLTSEDLARGFTFRGERIPLINPQRGIFKPTQMRFLLSRHGLSAAGRAGVVRRSAAGA